MLGYAKFLKDSITKKKIVSYEPVDNLHHYSAISIKSLYQKKFDLRAFIIPCTISAFSFLKAFYDLGECINLVPLSIYK